jgi:co-chaperonin GroES (HSP10)
MIAHHTKCYHFPLASFPFPPYNGRMHHQPGKANNPHKRQIPTPMQQPQPSSMPAPYFATDFIPARGYCLIECRFIGASKLIHIPDSVHSQQQYAIIRAMGPGKHHYQGGILEPEWKVGDFVYAAVAQGRPIQMPDKRMLVILGTEWIFGHFPNVPQSVVDEFANEEQKGTKDGVSTVEIQKPAP